MADDLHGVTLHHLAGMWMSGRIDGRTYTGEVRRRNRIAAEESTRAARVIRRARHGRA